MNTMMMREVFGVALLLLAVGVSAAGLLHIIGQGATRKSVSLLWTVAIAVLWAAWYIVQGRTL